MMKAMMKMFYTSRAPHSFIQLNRRVQAHVCTLYFYFGR